MTRRLLRGRACLECAFYTVPIAMLLSSVSSLRYQNCIGSVRLEQVQVSNHMLLYASCVFRAFLGEKPRWSYSPLSLGGLALISDAFDVAGIM